MASTDWLYKRAYEAWNYKLRSLAGGRWASNCKPTSIILLLTERCNAKCLHCDIWKNRGKEHTPTLEQWQQVMQDFRDWLGPVQVTISGGEALIKPFTIDLVSYASSIGIFLEILTHGYWKDQSKIEQLALAKPWKVTMSLDGVGDTHTKVRGKDNFWELSWTTIETLKRMRLEHDLGYVIRLKNVVMEHNLDDTIEVAKLANQPGMEVFYQAIEQNYNTPDDPEWYLHSENWPKDTGKAVRNIQQLIELKKQGYNIANSTAQLEAMVSYFENPAAHRMSIMAHSAHEARRSCTALNNLQFQSDGEVTVCTGVPSVGNIKGRRIQEIWENRPRYWESGCCLGTRCTDDELEQMIPAESLVALSSERE